jgi:mono/diheme cytochrome c family protein
MRSPMKVAAWSLTAGLLFSSVAIALPWDSDMVDSQVVRAYQCWEWSTDETGKKTCVKIMQGLPEGVVSQDHPFSPTPFKTPPLAKMDMKGWKALPNPLPASAENLARGKNMFRIYCTPCHGKPNDQGIIEKLGTVAQPGRMPGVVPLTGATGVLSKRNDGQVYRVIRMGNAIMPAYSWAMSDDEMWSIVHYTRTLDNGAYTPPTPAPAPAEQEEASP